MECWPEFISKFIFLKNDQMLRPFSGLAPSKLKFCQTKLRVNYVNIEKSFDTIFNVSYGGWRTTLLPIALSGNHQVE